MRGRMGFAAHDPEESLACRHDVTNSSVVPGCDMPAGPVNGMPERRREWRMGRVNELWRSEEGCAREHAASNLSLCFEALTDEWA